MKIVEQFVIGSTTFELHFNIINNLILNPMNENQKQSQQLYGERWVKANPEEKAQDALNSIRSRGYAPKKNQEKNYQTFVNEITNHVKQNPKIDRMDLYKHTFSKMDSNLFEEDENQFENSSEQSSRS